MALKKNIVGRISRQWTKTEPMRDDNIGYDDIIGMKFDGVPTLMDKDWYVEFIDTTGRDLAQQVVNIYSIQRPKWNIMPRSLGDAKVAEQMERIIEWYFAKAAQVGPVRFHDEVMLSCAKYNYACAQLEWDDEYGFCVNTYHPNEVVYEYGKKLNWVAVVNNIPATAIIEKFSDYAKPNWFDKLTKGDEIGSALKKIQDLLDEDEEQRMMFVDYTDNKVRYTYCWPVSKEEVDDSFGYDDDGKEIEDLIVIQDKENKLGYVNWAVARGVGDPLLAPFLKGNQYNNINDMESVLMSKLFKNAFDPEFIQTGSNTKKMEVDHSGDTSVAIVPMGSQVTPNIDRPLDPAFTEAIARQRNYAMNAIGLASNATLQISNVQHSTLQEQIKLRLAQLEPYKRVAEQVFIQLAVLMFRYAKAKNKVLSGTRMYSKGPDMMEGAEVAIEPDDIVLDKLQVSCKILPNNEHDKLQLANTISMLKQAQIPVPDEEFVEQFFDGDPAWLRQRWQKQEMQNLALEVYKQQKLGEVQVQINQMMAQFQAQLQQQMAVQQAGMEQAQQGIPSDVQGQGMNAGQGGLPPQVASPEITQGTRQ
jgi:hypothetical protein